MTQPSARVLFFDAGSGFGGSSKALYRLLRKLDRNRFQPIVLGLQKGPNFETIEKLGIETLILPPSLFIKNSFLAKIPSLGFFFGALPMAGRIKKLLREKAINLVVLNTGMRSGLPALMAAKCLKLPCLSYQRGATNPFSFGERLFTSWVDHYMTVSKKVKTYLEPVLRRYKGQVTVVYDGLDTAEIKASRDSEAVKRELNLPPESYLILLAGRMVDKKGHVPLIRAAAKICPAKPHVRFLIVGDDPAGDGTFKRKLHQTVKDMGLEKGVLFLGWRNDIYDFLNAADLVVNPSEFEEGLGNANLEAMAMGKPIICSNTGGYPEMVIDRKTGLLVTPGDAEGLAKAIVELEANRSLAAELGRNARQRLDEIFSIEKITEQFEDLLGQYAGKKAGV